MENKNYKKIVDGRMQLGIVSDWILNSYKGKLTNNEMFMFMRIAEQSLQRYHKKSPNIEAIKFNMSRGTRTKCRERLIELNLIGYKRTKAYSAYWLQEPKNELTRFVFSNDKHNDSIDMKKSIPKIFHG